MPNMIRVLDSLKIFNASSEKNNMTYPTGTKHSVPVYCEAKGKSSEMKGSNYFVHIRKVLEIMRGKTPDPVIIEGILSHDTNDAQEIECMVTSFVDHIVSIQKTYKRNLIVLAPIPRVGQNQDMTEYVLSLHRTRLFTRILYLYAASFGVVVIETEGYLYSVPKNKEWTKWLVKGPFGRGIELLRNADGSCTSNLLNRAAVLLSRIIDSYRRFNTEMIPIH